MGMEEVVLDRGSSRELFYNHRYNIVLFIFMLLDFLYTYIGIIYLGVITEGNPIMVWLFELDFIPSLIFRLFQAGLLVGLTCYLRHIKHKWYPMLIGIGLTANVSVIILHLYWLITVYSYI